MKTFEFLKNLSGFAGRNKLVLLFLLIYFGLATFFLRGVNFLDPDFGWRFRVGQLISDSGIPKTDPFSYSMPSFSYVDHSWLFSLLIYLTYPVFNNTLLSLVLVFAVFFSIFFANERLEQSDFEHGLFPKKYDLWFHPMSIIVISFLFNYFLVRAQILSWLIFTVLNYLLFKKDNYTRYKYFFPIIFFVWANIHGGYFLGILLLIYFVGFRIIVNKKGSRADLFILIACIFATLATPYKFEGWREVFSSVFDSRLRWTISEWMPTVTFFDPSMAFFIAISTFMLYMKRKNIPKIQFFLFWGLLIFGLTSRRNMPYFMLYTLPLSISAINSFYLDIRSKSLSKERFFKVYGIVVFISVVFFVAQMYFGYWKSFVKTGGLTERKGFYPTQAVNFLKERDISGQIYSSYGWGGYLIWKMPGKKVFIDGRMPSWRFTPPDENRETASAQDDYIKIEKGELDFNSVSDKYGIEYVLWPKESDSFLKTLTRILKDANPFSDKKKEFKFIGYLQENGWVEVYSDSNSVVMRRFNQGKI